MCMSDGMRLNKCENIINHLDAGTGCFFYFSFIFVLHRCHQRQSRLVKLIKLHSPDTTTIRAVVDVLSHGCTCLALCDMQSDKLLIPSGKKGLKWSYPKDNNACSCFALDQNDKKQKEWRENLNKWLSVTFPFFLFNVPCLHIFPRTDEETTHKQHKHKQSNNSETFLNGSVTGGSECMDIRSFHGLLRFSTSLNIFWTNNERHFFLRVLFPWLVVTASRERRLSCGDKWQLGAAWILSHFLQFSFFFDASMACFGGLLAEWCTSDMFYDLWLAFILSKTANFFQQTTTATKFHEVD